MTPFEDASTSRNKLGIGELRNGGDRRHLAPRAAGRGAGPCLADRGRRSSSIARGGPRSSIHGTFNNGEDFTRPLNRFDLRQRYERLPDDGGLEPEKWVTTLRTDLWTGVGEGWKLYGRADLPLVYSNNVTSSFNPNGHASSAWATS